MTNYAILLGSSLLAERLFGEDLDAFANVPAHRVAPVATSVAELDAQAALTDIEVLVTGWGTPSLTHDDLASMPSLRALIHAGGVASTLLPPHTERQVELSSAADINGVPVAEYTLAMILLANKRVFASQQLYRSIRGHIDREETYSDAGNFGQVVGIVGASRIGRRVIELLRPFDVRVLVFDPYLSDADAASLGVDKASLEHVLAESQVVSLHAPVTPETESMIGAEQLASLSSGATLINTARGALVDMEALTAELTSGRLSAILDVTDPEEPIPSRSVLWDLPNVVLTPHVAGSMGTELRRLGNHVAAELMRYAKGEPFNTPERS